MAKVKRDNMLFDDIVLFEILPRLPARSLGRCKCVCKQWHSFLKTPAFTKMHLHRVNSQNCEKLLFVSKAKPCKYFRTMDCETPEIGLSANRSLPFEANNISMISSLNGLVCVGINLSWASGVYNFSDIILWNPLTGEYKKMSKGNNCSSIAARVYGLYYSCCDDDYKLLRVTESKDTYIYSWKSDSWRKAKSRVDSLLQFCYVSGFLNEKLYFLANTGTQYSDRIVRFDTKTEIFTEMATPYSSAFDLMFVRGCIHVFVGPIPNVDRYTLELWKMDGDGEWTKVLRFYKVRHGYLPWGLMANGNWFLHPSQKMIYVNEVDPKMSKEAIEVCRWYNIDEDTMKILRKGKFVETIVSLKQIKHGADLTCKARNSKANYILCLQAMTFVPKNTYVYQNAPPPCKQAKLRKTLCRFQSKAMQVLPYHGL